MKKKTNAELRVEIARDVIKHIKAKKIIAECGTYFQPETKRKNSKFKGEQLQKVLPKLKECKVCALGGLFYGFVDKHNNFEVSVNGIKNTSFDDAKMRELMDIFEVHQLLLIETAFEKCDIGGQCRYNGHYNMKTIRIAIQYREKHNLDYNETITEKYEGGDISEEKYDAMTHGMDGKALTHIMKNIIANKGTFKP